MFTASTLLVLAGLGVLAWLLAGGWPYVQDRYADDDGPVGLGAGITAVCPGCAHTPAGPGDPADQAPRTLAAMVGTGAHGHSLRPLAVGRDATLYVECPSCGAAYTVLGTPSAVLPAPREAAD